MNLSSADLQPFIRSPRALLEGRTVQLEDFRGQVLLIVNTASQCGFTAAIRRAGSPLPRV